MWRKVFALVWTLAVVSIAAVSVSWFLTRQPPFSPFGDFPSPQKIVHRKPFYRPGEFVEVRGTKCYRGRAVIPYSSLSWWQRVSPARFSITRKIADGVRDPLEKGNEHGCFTATFYNQLPIAMPDGVWRLEGQQRSVRGTEAASAGWYTETFRVRNRP